MFRRHTISWLGFTLTLLALALPASASAIAISPACPTEGPCTTVQPANPPVSQYPAYKGWGFIDANLCAPNQLCTLAYAMASEAWRWSNTTGWNRTYRTTGETVYIYPYASGWTWTWSSSKGWLAMRSTVVRIGVRQVQPMTTISAHDH